MTLDIKDNSVTMNGMNIAEAAAKSDYPSSNLMVTESLGSGKTGTTASVPSSYSSTGALIQSDFGEGSRWYYLSKISRVNNQNPFEGRSPVAVSWELPLLESKDWQQVSFKDGMAEIPQGEDAHFILNGQLNLPGKFVIYSAESDAAVAEKEISDASKDCSTPNSRCSASLPTKDLPPGYYYITYSDKSVQISSPMAMKIGDPMDKGESSLILKDPATGKLTELEWTPKLATATYVKGNVNNKKITVIEWRADYPSGISVGDSNKKVVYDIASLGFPGLTFEVETDWKTHTTLKFSNGKSLKIVMVDKKIQIIPSATGDWGNSLVASSSADGSFVLTGEKKEHLTTVLKEEDCTPELIARLSAEKAELEKSAAELEAKQKELIASSDKVNSEISSLNEKKSILEDSIKSLKEKFEELQSQVQTIEKSLDEIGKNSGKLRSRIDELTRILADAEGLGIHNTGGNPLEGIDSGGAISYDGGSSWITFKGNAGAAKFIERMQKLKEIKKELLDLSKQLNDNDNEKQLLEKEKNNLNEQKSTVESQINDKVKELEGISKDLENKESEKANLNKQLDDLADEANELNDFIDAFNEKAEDCGIKARHTLIDAMNQLKNMPSEMQYKVREEFDKQATEEEKEAFMKSGYFIDDSKAAHTTTAADKLKDIMKEVSKCEEGVTKEGDYETFTSEFTIDGVEKVWIADWQGIRGKKMSEQEEIYKDASKAINVIDTIDTVSDIVDLVTDLNPVGLMYSLGFQGPATNAIMGQIKKWQTSGVLAGPPLWIQIGYGRLWDQDITRITHKSNIYICKEGIWQLSETKSRKEVEKSECRYRDGGSHEYDVPLENLNWGPSSPGRWSDVDVTKWSGNYPNGWEDSFRAAIQETFSEALKGYVIGKCE